MQKAEKILRMKGFVTLAFPVKELPNLGHILLKPKKQHIVISIKC